MTNTRQTTLEEHPNGEKAEQEGTETEVKTSGLGETKEEAADQNKGTKRDQPDTGTAADPADSEKPDKDQQDGGDEDKKEAEADEPEPKRQATSGGEVPKDVVEEGRISFLYRPKVSLEEAASVDDVQRFYMLMSPTSRKDAPHRLVAIGKKRLPKVEQHERFFGFVMAADAKLDTIMDGLKASSYETKTVGTRHVQAARAAGEGMYQIVLHDRTKTGSGRGYTYLAYQLEVPQEPGEVQKELGISHTGSFNLSIKNPAKANPPNAGLNDKADFKDEPSKQKKFGGYSWIGAQDPSLLDYERCEVLLVAATADIKGELGEAAEHLDKAAQEDIHSWIQEHHKQDEHEALIEKLRSDIHAEKEGISTEPAATGEWK